MLGSKGVAITTGIAALSVSITMKFFLLPPQSKLTPLSRLARIFGYILSL